MDATSLKLNQNSMKTRQELGTDAIRAAILRGRFRPGERLDQTDLAEEFEVSRSPVREALRILTAEELVTHFRHRGTVVTERSADELRELLFMRKLLEGAAASRAVSAMTDATLGRLGDIISEAESSSDTQRVLGLNNTFHATIYSAYEQPHLMDEIQKLRNKVAPYNRLYLDTPGHKTNAWADHRRIYEACLARDPERAAEETRRHLDNVFDGILESVEE